MPNRERTEVVPRTLDIMVLQTLASVRPRIGHAVAAPHRAGLGRLVQLNMGTMFPV